MKSLISISMHKAGSSIADQIVLDFCIEKGYEIDRISKQVPTSPLPEGDIYLNYQKNMKLNDVYYGMARGTYVKDMHIIQNLKSIVQIRDPRDCITSAYFSFKESHVPPKDPEKIKEFERKRNCIARMSIDEYACSNAKQYKMRMEILSNIIDSHNDVLLLKYEDMVENTDKWLEQISRFLNQPLTDSLLSKIGNKINFKVDKEDSSKHKRQVKPGDHVKKLKTGTILKMDNILKVQLEKFGYICNSV